MQQTVTISTHILAMARCACQPGCLNICDLLMTFWSVRYGLLRRQWVNGAVIHCTKLYQPLNIVLCRAHSTKCKAALATLEQHTGRPPVLHKQIDQTHLRKVKCLR